MLRKPPRTHPLVVHELVHAPGPQGGAHDISNGNAGVDVADQLGLALAGVRALPQQDDLRLLQGVKRGS